MSESLHSHNGWIVNSPFDHQPSLSDTCVDTSIHSQHVVQDCQSDPLVIDAHLTTPSPLPRHLLSLQLNHHYRQIRLKQVERCQTSVPQTIQCLGKHYQPVLGEELNDGRYVVLAQLGQGAFGTVVRCFERDTGMDVAVKIMRSGPPFEALALAEATLLTELWKQQTRESFSPGVTTVNQLPYMVQYLGGFIHAGHHPTLVFELLALSLEDLLSCTLHQGISLSLTRKFAKQLFEALALLEACDPPVIHADIKPANVMLKSSNRSGIRLVDFGSAGALWQSTFAYGGHYIQSRFYRAPEVMLALPHTTAMDRWSVGCLLMELRTGKPLFPGRDEEDQLVRIMELCGEIPPRMMAASPRREYYRFNKSQTKTLQKSSAMFLEENDDELTIPYVAQSPLLTTTYPSMMSSLPEFSYSRLNTQSELSTRIQHPCQQLSQLGVSAESSHQSTVDQRTMLSNALDQTASFSRQSTHAMNTRETDRTTSEDHPSVYHRAHDGTTARLLQILLQNQRRCQSPLDSLQDDTAFIQLISGLLQIDPQDRLTVEDCLQHSFIRE